MCTVKSILFSLFSFHLKVKKRWGMDSLITNKEPVSSIRDRLLFFSDRYGSDRGHLVAGYSFDDYRVGPETGLDVSLEVNEPVVGCDVKFSVNAFPAHAVCHMNLVVSKGYGNSDGLGVSEVSHRDVVQIDTEAYCHAEGVAHTVHLDDAVFGKNEGVVALGAVAVAGYVCYIAA